jgi:hypothetical protein
MGAKEAGSAMGRAGPWQQEATPPKEEISRFVAQGNTLWIAGPDARGSWR